jgi:hypothetical protein
MTAVNNLLTTVLRKPEDVTSLTLTEWDLVICQARQSGLLARLYFLLQASDLLDACPDQPLAHLKSAWVVADKHAAQVRWEMNRIDRALSPTDHPILVLKGAAYLLADLPPAKGRLFADIDIMLPKARLDEAERLLFVHGWVTTHHDAYDQRYYRQWMHELPPLRHMTRQTVLDIHHTILPLTARIKPDPVKLWMDAVTIEGQGNFKVLAPMDMVLHSATHLFHDGELEHGLRDLVDLDALLRHFGSSPGFWPRLVGRAAELELTRPLYYALHYTSSILDTPVPATILSGSGVDRPGALMATLMDLIFQRALAPDHPSCTDRYTGIARWLLYVRSHYLRMPLYLLIPHLVRKSFKKQQTGGTPAVNPPQRQ